MEDRNRPVMLEFRNPRNPGNERLSTSFLPWIPQIPWIPELGDASIPIRKRGDAWKGAPGKKFQSGAPSRGNMRDPVCDTCLGHGRR